ncbi:MAG: DUF4270 family protein [Chitinophagia bacterium]|jgi:hypothetical protein
MASNNIVRNILISFASLLTFSACTKVGTTDLGLGLLPSLDYYNTKDTSLEVITMTADYPDTLRVFTGDYHVIGSITDDAVFGTTKATMFFQLKPDYFPFFIPGLTDSLVVDSAVLILSYKGFYGDSTKPVVINVRRIDANTPLRVDSTKYPSNYPELYPMQTDMALAAPYTLDFTHARDSVYNKFEAAVNQIRIPLNMSFANLLMKGYDSNGAYHSDTTLRSYFPGFALSTDPSSNKNVLIQISLLDTNTKLALYYKSTSANTSVYQRDTAVVNFKFSVFDNGDVNFIKRNTAGSEMARHINQNLNDSLVYVQTSPGTMVKIKIPGLKAFKNKIIHRAELLALQVPASKGANSLEPYLLPPNYLFLGAYDSVNKVIRNVPNDFDGITGTATLSHFGGRVQYKSLNGYDNVATYNFSISRYVQGVISRSDSVFDFRILAPVNDSIQFVPPHPYNTNSGVVNYLSTSSGNQPAMGRVRLGGGTHSKFRMRLHIYYSDL